MTGNWVHEMETSIWKLGKRYCNWSPELNTKLDKNIFSKHRQWANLANLESARTKQWRKDELPPHKQNIAARVAYGGNIQMAIINKNIK